jgi:hypothetical protein
MSSHVVDCTQLTNTPQNANSYNRDISSPRKDPNDCQSSIHHTCALRPLPMKADGAWKALTQVTARAATVIDFNIFGVG